MGQPWGLSGPQFLVVYAVGFGAVLLITAVVRQVLRGLPSRRPVRQLDHYEVAFLAGGKQRVAEVVIAEMVDRGALRVDSKGRLTPADPSALGGPFAAAIGSIPASGMSTNAVRSKIGSDPGIKEVVARVRADGLIMSADRLTVLRWAFVLLMSALLGTGIARIMEGKDNHRPVGDLVTLVVLSAIIGVWILSAIWKSANTTRYGRYQLRKLRRAPLAAAAGSPLAGAAVPGGQYGFQDGGFAAGPALATAAVFGVALWGFKAVPDQTIRAALIAGLPGTSGASNCGGGSSCGGGGGGCGGGGCGG